MAKYVITKGWNEFEDAEWYYAYRVDAADKSICYMANGKTIGECEENLRVSAARPLPETVKEFEID